jgi:hypothetical protein
MGNEQIEFGSAHARDTLIAHGLTNLEALLEFGDPLPCRHVGRGLALGELTDGSETIQVFLKKQTQVLHRIPRLIDLRQNKGFLPYPVCEWRGLAMFREAGFLTPEPLVLARRGWYSPRSVVMVRALPCKDSLAELIRQHLPERLEPSDRAALIDALAGTIKRIHAAGLGWRGMEAKHFYPEHGPDGAWRVWLLDCESVHRRVTRHDVRQQREKFVRKLRELRADEAFIDEIRRQLTSGQSCPGSCPAGANG